MCLRIQYFTKAAQCTSWMWNICFMFAKITPLTLQKCRNCQNEINCIHFKSTLQNLFLYCDKDHLNGHLFVFFIAFIYEIKGKNEEHNEPCLSRGEILNLIILFYYFFLKLGEIFKNAIWILCRTLLNFYYYVSFGFAVVFLFYSVYLSLLGCRLI